MERGGEGGGSVDVVDGEGRVEGQRFFFFYGGYWKGAVPKSVRLGRKEK